MNFRTFFLILNIQLKSETQDFSLKSKTVLPKGVQKDILQIRVFVLGKNIQGRLSALIACLISRNIVDYYDYKYIKGNNECLSIPQKSMPWTFMYFSLTLIKLSLNLVINLFFSRKHKVYENSSFMKSLVRNRARFKCQKLIENEMINLINMQLSIKVKLIFFSHHFFKKFA